MVLINKTFNFPQFHRLEPTRTRQLYRVKSKLRFSTLLANVNVRRFVEISLIKPELVSLAAQDNRHMIFFDKHFSIIPAAAV